MIVETIQSDLYDMVQKHDWSYMMSDSHSVWEVGMRHEAGIKAKLHALIGVHKEDAESLYKWMKDVAGADYNDYDSKGRGLKYRVIDGWFNPYIDEVN